MYSIYIPKLKTEALAQSPFSDIAEALAQAVLDFFFRPSSSRYSMHEGVRAFVVREAEGTYAQQQLHPAELVGVYEIGPKTITGIVRL